MTEPDLRHPATGVPPGPARRAVLTAVPAAVATTALAAPPAVAATPDDAVTQALKALAAYVLPGDDPYSVQQRLTRPGPGAVAAGTDRMLRTTYDKALGIGVAPSLQVRAPGALGVALLLGVVARSRFLVESLAGPFAHGFANLSHGRKAQVLAGIDLDPALEGSPIGYAFGTLVTLTAFGAYSEAGVLDPVTRRLTGRPVGWDLARYEGVSDGRPEFRGYWKGRTSAEEGDRA
jgi:hypothetical protein